VRELGQKANGVYKQYSHVTWQLSGMYCNIQGGKELVFRLKTSISSQCFNQSCFTFRNKDYECVFLTISYNRLTN